MYKMSAKKVFDVLRELQRTQVISMTTAKMIAATYAERQLDPHKKDLPRQEIDGGMVCTTCGQTVLPF